jgi:hypothetical protein
MGSYFHCRAIGHLAMRPSRRATAARPSSRAAVSPRSHRATARSHRPAPRGCLARRASHRAAVSADSRADAAVAVSPRGCLTARPFRSAAILPLRCFDLLTAVLLPHRAALRPSHRATTARPSRRAVATRLSRRAAVSPPRGGGRLAMRLSRWARPPARPSPRAAVSPRRHRARNHRPAVQLCSPLGCLAVSELPRRPLQGAAGHGMF